MTVRASNFSRVENDLYETEEWATEALLRAVPMDGLCGNGGYVWEPAAGNHKIADVLKGHGLRVKTSDICVYDRRHDLIFDFLRPAHDEADKNCRAIITNPPYGSGNRDAARFAEQALRRTAGFVALLLPAKFDSAKTRRHLFGENPRFFAKVVLLDRISWARNGQTGTEDHAWYIWCPALWAQERGKSPPRLFYERKQPQGALQ